MNDRRNFKRPLLWMLIGSVLFGAVLGIAIVLRNAWSWFEIRVILTTLVIAVASLCGLACDLSRTPRGANLLVRGGLLLTFLAAGLILLGMWSDIHSEGYWKTTTIASIFAIATVHVCLLSIARLSKRFSWVYLVTFQVVYGLAALLSAMILGEMNDDQTFRILITLAILDAALTLVIPLLHRISRTEAGNTAVMSVLEERNIAAIDEELTQLRSRIAELEKLRMELAREAAGAAP